MLTVVQEWNAPRSNVQFQSERSFKHIVKWGIDILFLPFSNAVIEGAFYEDKFSIILF